MTLRNVGSLLLFMGLIILGVTGENDCQRKMTNDPAKRPRSCYCGSRERPVRAPCYEAAACRQSSRHHDRW